MGKSVASRVSSCDTPQTHAKTHVQEHAWTEQSVHRGRLHAGPNGGRIASPDGAPRARTGEAGTVRMVGLWMRSPPTCGIACCSFHFPTLYRPMGHDGDLPGAADEIVLFDVEPETAFIFASVSPLSGAPAPAMPVPWHLVAIWGDLPPGDPAMEGQRKAPMHHAYLKSLRSLVSAQRIQQKLRKNRGGLVDIQRQAPRVMLLSPFHVLYGHTNGRTGLGTCVRDAGGGGLAHPPMCPPPLPERIGKAATEVAQL